MALAPACDALVIPNDLGEIPSSVFLFLICTQRSHLDDPQVAVGKLIGRNNKISAE